MRPSDREGLQNTLETERLASARNKTGQPLRGRAKLEAEIREFDDMRARGNRLLLAKKITGFQLMDFHKTVDGLQRAAEMQLVALALGIADKEHARKNQVEVMQTHDGKALRKSAGKWIPVTKAELQTLQMAGQDLKIVRPKGARDIRPEQKESTKWQTVSREEGRRLSAKGECVKFGEGNSAEVLKG